MEEPSVEDFEAAAQERPPTGVRPVLIRILKSIGILFVVLALLLYLVVPLRNAVWGPAHDWPRPGTGPQQIPVAPEPTSTPVRRA